MKVKLVRIGGMLLLLLLIVMAAHGQNMPTLTIAVSPALNALPLVVAQSEGFYEAQGVTVELVTMDSGEAVQAALETGAADGALTDLLRVILLVNNGHDVRAVRSMPVLGRNTGLVTAAESGFEHTNDLKGMFVAVAENTLTEFLTAEMLLKAGFFPPDMVFEDIPDVDARFDQVITGQVAAAALPEPWVTLAVETQGAKLLASDASGTTMALVVAFQGERLDDDEETVRAFLAAVEQAVNALNADPEAYRDVMNTYLPIPEALQATYPVPGFPVAGVLRPAAAQAIIDWMANKGLIAADTISYDAVVETDLLPPVGTIMEVARGDLQFSVLIDAVEAAGLVEALSAEGPLTIFAPTNDAFALALESMGITLEDFLSETDTLRDILRYHIIEREYSVGTLMGMADPVMTLLGEPMTFTTAEGILINGTYRLNEIDVFASNGVIHPVDDVFLPPSMQQ